MNQSSLDLTGIITLGDVFSSQCYLMTSKGGIVALGNCMVPYYYGMQFRLFCYDLFFSHFCQAE